MKHLAAGTFEVSMKPQSPPEQLPSVSLGRMALEKQFFGDLVATGKGEMLTAVTQTKGSAGYVAIEQVTGELQGRRGSFVFQHSGIMSQQGQNLSITVVPDSGADQLTGISGKFTIKIVEGKHFYEFEYELPE